MFSSPFINPFNSPFIGLNRYGSSYATTFGSYAAVPLDTVVMSRTIQTQATGAISITADLSGTGEYQINGGLWTSAPGTVVPGDLIRARLTSSALYETLSALEITIDGVADTFSVTTVVESIDLFAHYTGEENYTDTNHYTD